MRNYSTKNPLLACMTLGAAILMVAQGPMGTGAYFSDIENSTANIFQAGTWIDPQSPFNIVLNEFLPRPDTSANGYNFGNDASNIPLGEWVELYNNGTEPLDVAGWELRDESGGLGNTQAIIGVTNTAPATTTIPAGGWLVVYFNKPVLNNTTDTIFLFTSTSTGHILIDSYAYGSPSDFCENEPSPGMSNATSTPSCIPGQPPNADCSDNQVSPNKSYARIPDGTGDWVDPIPTPGAPNIAEEEPLHQGSTLMEAESEPLPVEVSNEPLEVMEPATSTSSDEPELEVEVSDEPLVVEEPTEVVEEPVKEEPAEDPASEPEPEEEPAPET